MLVDNPQEDDACISGVLTYQRCDTDGRWTEVDSIGLNKLKTGEGVRIKLHAGEILHLHKALGALYDSYSETGIPTRRRRYALIDAQSRVKDLLDAATANPENIDGLSTIVDWFANQDPSVVSKHFRPGSQSAAKLDSALGIARLENFIEAAERLLSDSGEDDWQQLLADESWAIGQLYAQPVVIVRGQVYVGGKGIDGRGGNVADFLYRNALSDNCMLVEIKRSDTPLVVVDKTSRNNVVNISPHVTGAAQQLLQSRRSLSEEYLTLTRRGAEFVAFSPRMLLIVGSYRSLKTEEMISSFELYRGEQRNLQIVTFDELVKKAQTLLDLLRST